MKTVAIIQARIGSTRLPGKVMLSLEGFTVLDHVINRVKTCKKIDEVIVATTINEKDLKIVDFCKEKKINVFCGSEDNVLNRYYQAAKENKTQVVVRITSDCPCVDPDIIDLMVEKHLESGADYTSNTLRRTFPHGLDAEVFNFEGLERVHAEADNDYEKEHVTPYFYKTNPHLFKLFNVEAEEQMYAPDIRITLDTEQDYVLICAVYDQLYSNNEIFKAQDIVALFKQKPWLYRINEKVPQKKIKPSLKDELDDAIGLLELHSLRKATAVLSEYRNKC